VAALVVLRLCLGCHFLYEGVWKIKHADEFTAEPFLSMAKGPLSGFFYAMIPDQNGRQRLTIDSGKDKDGKPTQYVDTKLVADRWSEIRQNLISSFNPGPPAGEDARKIYEKFKTDSNVTLEKHQESLREYFAEKDTVHAIEVYFQSLDRFEADPEKGQSAPFQKERRWNRMMELRGEAKVWIDELQTRELAYLNALYDDMKSDEYRAKFSHLPGTWKVWKWTQMQQINFAVTYGITAIGICLFLGFFTRLAALGGAAFMCFVVMTQPAWPTIYPFDLPQLGHALLINKDFIEMMALLVIASSPAGRWGGLDHFVHCLIVEPFMSKRLKS
jgi:uncharacterized membrane protein YphA (DoxX/SURF4 family)